MNNNRMQQLALVATAALCTSSNGVAAFAPSNPTRQSTSSSSLALALGIPKFLLPDDAKEQQEPANGKQSAKKEDKKLDAKGLLQLITAGAGGTCGRLFVPTRTL